MPRVGAIAAVVMLGLLGGQPLWAGLYSMEEPPRGYRVPRKGVQAIQPERFFRDYLPELIQLIPNAQLEDRLKPYLEARDGSAKAQRSDKLSPAEKLYVKYRPLRQQYQERKEDLERKQRRGQLTIPDRVNLSFYLLRQGQPVEALGVLKDPSAQASRHFMVYANLGTAYQMLAGAATNPSDRARDLGNALVYLKAAQAAWPRKWPAWSKEQLAWFKEAEKQHSTLVRLRWKEALEQSRRPAVRDDKPFDNVDALFPVQFVDESGRLADLVARAAEQARLKGDEVPLVQQLLTWLPTDNRLYWLLGELLNAQGDVATAAAILEDCVKGRNLSNVPLLRKHRSLLQESLAQRPKESSPSWLPERWQLLTVGGVGCLLITLLVYFQIKEIRRRRQRHTPPS